MQPPSRVTRLCCNGAPATASAAVHPPSDATRAARTRPEVTHGHHDRIRRHDQRGDRPPDEGAHLLLVVGPGGGRPDRHRSCRGRLPLHAGRPADPRFQQPADVGQHRPWRSSGGRCHHRPGDEARVRPARLRDRDPGPSRGEAGRDPARRHGQGLLHARWRGGDRERDQARPRGDRPAQDPCPLSLVPRRDARGDDPDRRPATLAERTGHRRRRPLPRHAPLGRGGTTSRGREPPGSRGRHPLRGSQEHRRGLPRDDRRHERHPHPARRLHPGRPRDLHAQRHPDGRRRGDGRLRAHRALVRDRSLGRHARPDDDGQGPDQLVPAARGGGDAPRASPRSSRTRCSTAG